MDKPKRKSSTPSKAAPPPSKIQKVVKEHKEVYRKVSTPSKKEWFKEYRRVTLGIVALALFFMGIDWLLGNGVSLFQGWIAGPGIEGVGAGLFITLLVISGLVLALCILLQRGTTDGLTSLFGSGVEYGGGSIAGLTGRLSSITLGVGVFFALLCLVSPLVLR